MVAWVVDQSPFGFIAQGFGSDDVSRSFVNPCCCLIFLKGGDSSGWIDQVNLGIVPVIFMGMLVPDAVD